MSPFNQDDLIAYHLHELPWYRVRALRRALQTDPALASESDAIAATLRAFPKDEPAPPLTADALDKYWLALLPALVAHAPNVAPPRPLLARSLSPGWSLAALAGIALVASTLFVSLRHHRPILTAPFPPVASSTPSLNTSGALHTLSPSQLPHSTLLAGSAPRGSSPRPLFPFRAQQQPWTTLAPPPSSAAAQPSPSSVSSTPLLATTEPSQPSTTASTQLAAQPGTAQTASAHIPSHLSSHPPSQIPAQLSADHGMHLASAHSATLRPAHGLYHPHTTDVSLAVFADLTASDASTSTSGAGTSLITQSHSQTVSPAVGALASFHQQLRPWLGYRVTATYSHPTFAYSNIASTSSHTDSSGPYLVNTMVYELGGTYVVQGPHRRRLTTSVEAGASLLDFVPNQNDSQTSSMRAAAIVGVGTEYSLTKRISVRVEYRAQIYKAPAFSDANITGGLVPTFTVFSSNPILGVTYHFGRAGDD